MADTAIQYDAEARAEAERQAAEDAAKSRAQVQETIRQWTQGWRDKIDVAWKYKEDKFGRDAREAFSFFGSDHSFLFNPNDPRCLKIGGAAASNPGFEMTYNIVAELVQLFGPAIYHRNPNRQCKPVLPLELRRDAYVDPALEYECNKLKQMAMEFVQRGAAQHSASLVAQGMPESQASQAAAAALQQSPEFKALSEQVTQLEGQIFAQQSRYEQALVSQQSKLTGAYTKSDILERLLNYGPEKCDLRTNSRRVVDETLIKGQGVWWTNLKVTPDGKQTVVGSFYKSIDHFLVDPDCEVEEDAMWVGERCVEPVWKFEQDRHFPPGSCKGNLCSQSAERGTGIGDAWNPTEYGGKAARGQTCDLIVYWKIYSKMGAGSRLRDMAPEAREVFERFGPYVYLEITPAGCLDHPANLTADDIFDKPAEDVAANLAWPTPFWQMDAWPCTTLSFHWVSGSPYGMSHIKPGIGELKFLDWAMSQVARKMEHACDDLIGVIDSAGEDIKKQLTVASKSGYKFLQIPAHFGKSVGEIVSMMQLPPFNGDIWNVIAAVAARLDKRLGLTELAYGLASTQSRSALDSQFKQQQYSIRPDDMASQVEEAAAKLAAKEAYAAAYHLTPGDVRPVLGDAATELFAQFISPDPIAVIREFDYTIEANSVRRPNKERDIENANLMTQIALPVITQYSMSTANYEPLNWFFKTVVGETYDVDVTGLRFTPPPPPPQPQPTPEQLEAMRLQSQTAQAKLLAELQQSQNLQLQLQVKAIELRAQGAEADLKLAEQAQKLAHEAQAHQQKLAQAAERHDLEMIQDREEHVQEMTQDREEMAVRGKNRGNIPYQ
jgi:hypothetical protein